MNTAMAFTLEEFNNQVANMDFQRSNLFSLSFATRPGSKSQHALNDMAGNISDSVKTTLGDLGINIAGLDAAIQTIITLGTQKLIRKSGVSKRLMGAMSNRVIRTLLGDLPVGAFLLDYFDSTFPMSGLWIQSIKIPDNSLSHEIERLHNAPNIKLTGRTFEPLILTFRMDPSASNYRAMNDWINAVEDPITGLRALPAEVEADIQVNLHDRKGMPHTAYMFSGCVPVIVSGPQLSYEQNNEITTFDVTFAYRSMQVGGVGIEAAKEWLEDATIELGQGMTNPNMNISPSSRLG